MPSPRLHLPEPELTWRGDLPISLRHGDVYFAGDNGLGESRHVFLAGIGAPALWWERASTVIGEIGFGTGLNFLATWAAWRERPGPGVLHYLAVEGAPLRAETLARALAPFHELAELARALRSRYPPGFPGLHRLSFDGGAVQLTLAFGEAGEILEQLEAPVDAWYLDGFAPTRNPDAWRPGVIEQITRLSRPRARLASFTVAGKVRTDLAAAGFRLEKRAGFAGKRACLAGRFEGAGAAVNPERKPWFGLPPASGGPVAVIGSGIAAAWCARACRAEGLSVCIIGERAPDPLPAAVLAPRVNLGAHAAGRFSVQAMLHAWRAYDALAGVWTGPRGVVQLLRGQNKDAWGEKALERLAWPASMLRRVAPEEAGALAGAASQSAALAWPRAGCLDARAVLRALTADIERIDASAGRIEPSQNGWLVRDPAGFRLAEAASVIVAAGPNSGTLLGGDAPPLTFRRGQVSFLPPAAKPEACLSFGGTLTPGLPALEGARMLGSTFEATDSPDESPPHPREADHRANLALLARALPDLAQRGAKPMRGWAGLRAATRDHMPVAGPVADMAAAASAYAPAAADWKQPGFPPAPYRTGLYVVTGLAARGFQTAPLLAAVVAAQIAGSPLPIERSQREALHPLRFLLRDILRGRLPTSP